MFSNKDLKNVIIPLFLEQLLTILVGLADMQMEFRAFETYFEDCGSEWRGAGDFPVCQGGVQQHCRFVWNLSNCGQQDCTEYLVPCRFGLCDDAMSLDWCVRAVAFYVRFKGGKWKNYQLI